MKEERGRAAIKAILIMGAGVFILLGFMSFGLKRSLEPNAAERVKIRQKNSPFDAGRAMTDLSQILAFGIRTSESPGMLKTQAYLTAQLRQAGLRVWEEASPASGEVARKVGAVVAVSEGTKPGILLFATHTDAAPVGGGYLGANDGASTSAWLLEWARSLGPAHEGPTCWMVWFGNEGAGNRTSPTSSHAFVEKLRRDGSLKQIRVMVGVEAIGDCYLQVQRDAGAPEWLQGTVWDTAERLGYRQHFGPAAKETPGVQSAFRDAGIPALLLADPLYGGSLLEHQKNWHTTADTQEKVCPESLQAIADVLYHALPAIEGRLETPGMIP